MFNRSAFGRVAYNRPFTVIVTGSATADVVVEALAKANVNTVAYGSADVIVEGTADGRRDVLGATATADVVVEAVASFMRERYGSGAANVIVEASARARFTRVNSITILSTFNPGEIIVIDSGKLKITKDGQNILNEMIGDFFDLNLGDNNIQYDDDETARDILTRITFQDKLI